MADVTSTWQKIQQGVKETERLIGQRQYNLAMVKARQTLEYMIKSLGERACILDGDMSDIIDQLYEGQWITRATRDNYHKIRIIGNKAVHEGNDNSSDAGLAYQLLAQEAYAYANEYTAKRRRPQASPAPRPRSRGTSRPNRKKRRRRAPLEDFLRILIPVICVVLLIFIIRAILPDKEKDKESIPETSAPVESVTEPTFSDIPETTPAETETLPPETSSTAIYRTTSTLNVRKEPSTDARILVQLAPNTEITVTGTYDAQWTIINYEGQDAYVATAYITQ